MASPSTATAYSAETGPIDPWCTYPLAAFIRASGISKSRLREARLIGCPLPTFNVGKRVYVRGADACEWLEELSNRTAAANAKAEHNG